MKIIGQETRAGETRVIKKINIIGEENLTQVDSKAKENSRSSPAIILKSSENLY